MILCRHLCIPRNKSKYMLWSFQVFRTMGLQAQTPISKRSSLINTETSSPRSMHRFQRSNADDIAALDKLLTSILGMKDHRRSFYSNRGTPRSSQMAGCGHNRRIESWSDRMLENSIVHSVLNNLKANKRNSTIEEPFLAPK